MSSIEHIRSTPGYSDGNWPPRSGMTPEENLSDLRRHADDFTRGAGYTFTVLDPGDNDVIGCVYLYPSPSEEWDVAVQSWVRADRSSLDVPLADAVARWLATNWPLGARGPLRSLSGNGTPMWLCGPHQRRQPCPPTIRCQPTAVIGEDHCHRA